MFEGRPFADDREQPRVTLGRKGVILLNAAACAHLKGPTAVKLMFDENQKRIGIKPADPREPNAFRLKRKKDATHRTINAGASAFRHLSR